MIDDEPFFRRQQRARGEVRDVYQYDELPKRLRVQLARLFGRIAGHAWCVDPRKRNLFPDGSCMLTDVAEQLRDALGVHTFSPWPSDLPCEDLLRFLEVGQLDDVMTIAEVCTRKVLSLASKQEGDPVAELNRRFLEAGVGYRFEGGMFVRLDSELLHAEVVRPLLAQLDAPGYLGIHEEFRAAHAHHRAGRHRDAITACACALESMLKAICARRGWPLPARPTLGPLVKAVLDQGLVPALHHNQLAHLAGLLSAGVAEVRNDVGAHGHGVAPVEIPGHVVRLVLHETATKLLFFVEAEAALVQGSTVAAATEACSPGRPDVVGGAG